MATKFFTNSGDNTLLNKFDGIFKNTSVHYFDALVAYFKPENSNEHNSGSVITGSSNLSISGLDSVW